MIDQNMKDNKNDEIYFDRAELRRCLGQFCTGVTVVTTKHAHTYYGVTANSFSSLSLSPPLILWSIDRSSRSFQPFMEADCFNVSILAENQFSVANVFSSKVDDKFENIEWHLGRNKVPIVTNAAGFLECEVERKIEAGDHVLLIGRVLHFGYSEQRSLGFAHGRYAVFSKHPHVA